MPQENLDFKNGYGSAAEWGAAKVFFSEDKTAKVFKIVLSEEKKSDLLKDNETEIIQLSNRRLTPTEQRALMSQVGLNKKYKDLPTAKLQKAQEEFLSRHAEPRLFVRVGDEILIQPLLSEKKEIGKGAFGLVRALCKEGEASPYMVTKYQLESKFNGSNEETVMKAVGVLQGKLPAESTANGSQVATIENFYPGHNAQCLRTGLKAIDDIQNTSFTKTQVAAFQNLAMDCYLAGFSTADFEAHLKKVNDLQPSDINDKLFINAIEAHADQLLGDNEQVDTQVLLQELREATTYSTEERLQTIVLLAGSLQKLHDAGFCHNDIKEANAIVNPLKGTGVVIDFGECTDKNITAPQFAKGTLGCCAPEVVFSNSQNSILSTASDVYSLGLMASNAGLSDLPIVKQALNENRAERPTLDELKAGFEAALTANLNSGMTISLEQATAPPSDTMGESMSSSSSDERTDDNLQSDDESVDAHASSEKEVSTSSIASFKNFKQKFQTVIEDSQSADSKKIEQPNSNDTDLPRPK